MQPHNVLWTKSVQNYGRFLLGNNRELIKKVTRDDQIMKDVCAVIQGLIYITFMLALPVCSWTAKNGGTTQNDKFNVYYYTI